MIDRNTVLNLAGVSSDINEYLMTLYNLPIQIKAKVIVELGAGYSTIALLAAANYLDAHLTSVDMGETSWYRAFPNDPRVYEGESRIKMIQEDDGAVYDKWTRPIDFLFLDTSHTYGQTRKELSTWPYWIKEGGMLVMHDTAHETGTSVGCRRALEECMDSPSFATIAQERYAVVHLLDTKILGMSVMVKLGAHD